MSTNDTETNTKILLVKHDNQKEEIKNTQFEEFQSGVNEEVFNFLKNLLTSVAEEQSIDGLLITVDTQLSLALHFLITGKDCNKFENIPPEYVKNYKMNLINCLIRIAPQFIKFPSEQEAIKGEFYALGKVESSIGFPHVLGIIGNTHVQLKKPIDCSEIFLNSNNQYSIHVQIVCGPDLQIYNVLAAFPGGCDGLFIWKNSNLRRVLRKSDNPNNSWLLGNSDYPQEPWLMTPIVNPNSSSEELYNKVHKITRQPIKDCIEILKSRFCCLRSILEYDPPEVYAIATACCVLHNIYIYYKDSLEIKVDLQEPESSHEEIISTNNSEEGAAGRETLIENYFNC